MSNKWNKTTHTLHFPSIFRIQIPDQEAHLRNVWASVAKTQQHHSGGRPPTCKTSTRLFPAVYVSWKKNTRDKLPGPPGPVRTALVCKCIFLLALKKCVFLFSKWKKSPHHVSRTFDFHPRTEKPGFLPLHFETVRFRSYSIFFQKYQRTCWW